VRALNPLRNIVVEDVSLDLLGGVETKGESFQALDVGLGGVSGLNHRGTNVA
jgi:hypothetical protein